MKKIFKKAMAIAGATLMAGMCTACGGGVPDTGVGCLDVYCHDAGYGVSWCEEMLKDFVKQDWVKAKHPGVEIKYSFQSESQDGYVKDLLNAGSGVNKKDLLFGFNSDTPVNKSIIEELTKGVYDQKVPGDELERTYEEKIYPSVLQVNAQVDANAEVQDAKYFKTSWAGGATGIYYNATKLRALGFNHAPRTTDELIEMCDTNPGAKDFIDHKGIPYWQYLFPQFWAQYEGVAGYNDYWMGIANDIQSPNIFLQEGRLEAAKVFEKLLKFGQYLDSYSLGTDKYIAQQTKFVQGTEGIFMVNGDWLEKEMAKAGVSYNGQDIRLMRTPIMSACASKWDMTEAELREAVDYVDGVTSTKPSWISNAQLKKVKEARGIVYSLGAEHISFVPSYAREKDLAKDFLVYMATDRAQSIYMKETGSTLPVLYDAQEKDPATFNALSNSQKALVEYLGQDYISYLPNETAFPLFTKGGVGIWDINKYSNYQVALSQQGTTVTAQKLYEDTLTYWGFAKEGGVWKSKETQRWNKAVTAAQG